MVYQIIIYPIEIIIEMIYFAFAKISANPGLSIIGVSLAVQILSLPLYSIAEKWQIRERETQKNLTPQIDRIKAVFKGDEQYMILSTYYRQEHYHPIFALRSTVSLLIQVPFFIAAYTFLSNLEALIGQSFYFIPNLGAPDALFTIGSFNVNILPIVMTFINVLAGAVYTKGFPLKEKIQLYAMSALFLVLLYNSPSGLVLYWTLNNIFSLCKSFVNKTAKPARTFYILAALTSIGVTSYVVLFSYMSRAKELLVCTITVLILAVPLLLSFTRCVILPQLNRLSINTKQRNKLFICACVGLFLLAGVFIPSALVVSSPEDFSFIGDYTSPIQLLLFPLFQAAGFFLFWIPAIYILFSQSIKNILTWLAVSAFVIALVNTFFLAGNYGFISNTLQFDTNLPLLPELLPLAIDGLIILTCAVILMLLIKFCTFKITVSVCGLLSASLLFLGSANYISIQKSHNTLTSILETESTIVQSQSSDSIEPVYNLSKDEQNVVVIMLDMAVGAFVPYVFEEFPETAKQFDGFTWYPNALSPASATVLGAHPPYGGYEYLPEKIMQPSGEMLPNKTSQAIAMLPLLFSEHGFNATMTNAPLGYGGSPPDAYISDIFAGKEDTIEFKKLNSATYRDIWIYENDSIYKNDKSYVLNTILKDNFILFSFFRMFPTSLRGSLYVEGLWWKIADSQNNSYFDDFLNNYAALYYLPQLTDLTSLKPTFNFIKNNTTHAPIHEPIDLKYMEEEARQDATSIESTNWDDRRTYTYYNANVAALKELGKWFDYLRKNNIYDNTKIIIVSDHGTRLKIPEFSAFRDSAEYSHLNPELFNVLLMEKDFNKNDSMQLDTSFMTNADVPFLATEGVIENPKNPFTDIPFSMSEKENGINVYTLIDWDNTVVFDFEIGHAKDNIFEPENWSKAE